MTFRTRSFVGAVLASSIALAVSTILVEQAFRRFMLEDVDAGLLNQARLASALLSHQETLPDPDQEAGPLEFRRGVTKRSRPVLGCPG